jgi:antitoxin VapB
MFAKRVSLFRNGANQAVRIPREFELPGTQAIIRKENGTLVIEPLPRPSLVDLLRTWEPIDDEIERIDDPPPEPVEI